MHLPTRRRVAAAATAIATVALTTGAAVGSLATEANALSSPRVITATMSAKAVRLSVGGSVHAGRVIFTVVSPSGDHVLQLARLAPGYRLAEAGRDINLAFSGNLKAIHRVDTLIHWFGGADARPGHPGRFAETLYAGTYLAIDQNSNAHTWLHVFGAPTPTAWIRAGSLISAWNHGFSTAPAVLPRSGWTLFRDTADEPHFLDIEQVKASTTATMVRSYLHSGAQGSPPWALAAGTGSGVISPHTQILFHYNLPAGKYLLMCWWPDDKTGMPHALMGMWKLVWLR